MNNKIRNYICIFNKYIKNNHKIIPFKVKINNIWNTRYFPPVSKEWKNSIYVFNQKNLKNFPIYDININNLIKDFFNIYFGYKFLYKNYSPRKLIVRSLNKIFASKADIKHTNNKAILTVYVYNREKKVLLRKIKKLKKSFYKKVKLLIYKNKKIFGSSSSSSSSNIFLKKIIKAFLYKNLILLRKYKLRLNLNKYKFEEKLLYKLKNFIVKFYNKKVEFNIVNIKSVVYHVDFFTKILTTKLSKKKIKISAAMDTILNQAVLPKVNRIIERSLKKKDLNFIENKYKYLNISFVLNNSNSNLSQILNNLYYNIIIDYNNLNKKFFKIYEIIFNSINYKNMCGIRIETKGRLTKRYRADRAVYRVRLKGGLRNIDSSFRGLSSVNMRGYLNSNVDYSIFTSTRRVGAFAVKGWVSGKS